MICGLEIGLAIFGILALVRGKLTISKNKVVVGIPARLLGLIALAPFPTMLLIGVVLGIMNAGDDQFVQKNQGMFIGVEVGIVILTAIVVFGVGAAVGVSPAEAERRERGSRYDEDDDDRRDRRDRDDDRDRDDERDDDRRDGRERKPWN